MNLPQRPSPAGKTVSLFVTCIVDLLFPSTGLAVVDLLSHLGVTVDFPQAQTCCGQPGFNAGFRRDARTVARQFLRTFESAEVVVIPSGSCTTMIRHEYPRLFADDPALKALAQQVAGKTWEFTEFLADGLGRTDLGLSLPREQTLALHESCHGLRFLGLDAGARALLDHLERATLVPLEGADECCGFGGLFSVKMPDLSGALLQQKIDRINACPADTIVVWDASCLIHIQGGLSRQGSSKRVRHIADVLADGLPHRQGLPERHPA